MLHCEFVKYSDPRIRFHLQKCGISHFISPLLSSFMCPVCGYVSMLCYAIIVLDSPEQRTGPALCNLTTGLHSSRGFKWQALSLLSESQEPEAVNDQNDHIFYFKLISPSHSPCLLSFHPHWYLRMWLNKQVPQQKLIHQKASWNGKELKDMPDMYLVNLLPFVPYKVDVPCFCTTVLQ